MPTATEKPPPEPLDTLASPRAAADLAGVPLPEVRRLIRDGRVRVERIRGAEFVNVRDVEAAFLARGGAS